MKNLVKTLKINVSGALKGTPKVFDAIKQASRVVGFRDDLYRLSYEVSSVQKVVSFIQIGSNDGTSNDPLREFIIRGGWRGVLVEPISYLFQRLQSNYRGLKGLQFENCAVSPFEREITLQHSGLFFERFHKASRAYGSRIELFFQS